MNRWITFVTRLLLWISGAVWAACIAFLLTLISAAVWASSINGPVNDMRFWYIPLVAFLVSFIVLKIKIFKVGGYYSVRGLVIKVE